MPNPTASPQVSSTVGLKNVVIAPLTADTEETLTYGELQLLAGAIEASITRRTPIPISNTLTTSSSMCCTPIPSCPSRPKWPTFRSKSRR